jgi:hypothetical protein
MFLIKMPPSQIYSNARLPVQTVQWHGALYFSLKMFAPFSVSAPHNATFSLCHSRAMPPTVKSFNVLGVISCWLLILSAYQTGKHWFCLMGMQPVVLVILPTTFIYVISQLSESVIDTCIVGWHQCAIITETWKYEYLYTRSSIQLELGGSWIQLQSI